MSATKAYAFRNGEIGFGEVVPDGALPILGPKHYPISIDDIKTGARLAYDGKTLLVPGVPEAGSDLEAYEAFDRWVKWLSRPKGAAPV